MYLLSLTLTLNNWNMCFLFNFCDILDSFFLNFLNFMWKLLILQRKHTNCFLLFFENFLNLWKLSIKRSLLLFQFQWKNTELPSQSSILYSQPLNFLSVVFFIFLFIFHLNYSHNFFVCLCILSDKFSNFYSRLRLHNFCLSMLHFSICILHCRFELCRQFLILLFSKFHLLFNHVKLLVFLSQSSLVRMLPLLKLPPHLLKIFSRLSIPNLVSTFRLVDLLFFRFAIELGHTGKPSWSNPLLTIIMALSSNLHIHQSLQRDQPGPLLKHRSKAQIIHITLRSNLDAIGEDIVVPANVALVVSHLVEIDRIRQGLSRSVLKNEQIVHRKHQPTILPCLEKFATFEEVTLSDEIAR